MFKFEIGQYVQLAHEHNPFGEDKSGVYHIVERNLQECPAGEQIWYSCRGHYRKWRDPRSISIQLIKLNETELAEVTLDDAKDAADDVKSQLVKLLARIEDREAGFVERKEKPMD